MPNTHAQPDTFLEIQSICGDLLPAVILSTTWPTVPVPPALTLPAFATTGYVRAGTTLAYVTQPAHILTLGGSDGQYWLGLHRDTHSAVALWSRQPGTHYLVSANAGQPPNPPGGLVFASVIVAGGVITSVTPLAAVSGNAPAWRAHLALGSMAPQDASAVAITGGSATLGSLLVHGLTPLPNLLTVQDSQGGFVRLATIQSPFMLGLEILPLTITGSITEYRGIQVGNVGPDIQGQAVYMNMSTGSVPRYNLYGAGNAPNFLAGSLGLATVPSYTLHVQGTAGIPGGAWINTTSRAALKQRRRPLADALALLRALAPEEWEWAADQPELAAYLPGTQAGFVVEDVALVRPDWTPVGTDGTPGLAMRGLEAYLVRGLQQLLARLEALEAP